MFRFILKLGNFTQVAKPLDVAKCKIKAEKQKEHIFFRRKFTGTLQFIEADYRFLAAVEASADRCLEIKLEVQKYCSGNYIPDWWKGYFSLNDVKFNHSKGVATVTPKADDAFRYILDYYGKDYNVLQVPASHTVSTEMDLEANFEFFKTGTDQQPDVDPDTWAVFLKATYWVDGTTFNKGERFNQDLHFRLVRTEPFLNGAARDLSSGGWSVIDEDQAAQTAKYAKRPDLYNFQPYRWGAKGDFDNYPDLLQVSCGGAFDDQKYIDVTANIINHDPLDCWNIREKINEDRWRTLIWNFAGFTFSRNRKLMDVLNFLVETSAKRPDFLPVKSDFFTQPVNYVTGEVNKYLDLLIAQKSDIIGYNSSEAARIGNLNLKALLDALRQGFEVYWFINDEGKFQLEHVSYFEDAGDFELTEAKYPDFLKHTNAYEYEKSEMPRFQKLKFAEASNPDFLEGIIEYSGSCVTYDEGADTEEETVSKVTTDIENLIVSGNTLSKDGFVLIAHQGGKIQKEAGAFSGKVYANAVLSAANLMRDLHTYNRILATGLVNNQEIGNFNTVRKTKKQISLRLNICCNEPNPYSRFITDVSENGSLQEMEVNLQDGVATFSIVHETGGSGAIDFERQFDDSFNFSFK